jgi:hypothetical protein
MSKLVGSAARSRQAFLIFRLRVLALSKYCYFYEVDETSPVLTDGFLIDRVIVSCLCRYYKGKLGSKTGRIRRNPSNVLKPLDLKQNGFQA